MFRGREMAHTELGRKILDRLVADLGDTAVGRGAAQAGRPEHGDGHRADEERPAGAPKAASTQAGGSSRRRRRKPRRRSRVDGSPSREDETMPKQKTHRATRQAVPDHPHRQGPPPQGHRQPLADEEEREPAAPGGGHDRGHGRAHQHPSAPREVGEMARVKRSVHAKKKRREVLRKAKGYYGSRSRRYRVAKEQLLHSGQYAYRDRRDRKGQFRRLWIARIGAGARQNGLSYSRFIHGLQQGRGRGRPEDPRGPGRARSGGVRPARRRPPRTRSPAEPAGRTPPQRQGAEARRWITSSAQPEGRRRAPAQEAGVPRARARVPRRGRAGRVGEALAHPGGLVALCSTPSRRTRRSSARAPAASRSSR